MHFKKKGEIKLLERCGPARGVKQKRTRFVNGKPAQKIRLDSANTAFKGPSNQETEPEGSGESLKKETSGSSGTMGSIEGRNTDPDHRHQNRNRRGTCPVREWWPSHGGGGK